MGFIESIGGQTKGKKKSISVVPLFFEQTNTHTHKIKSHTTF